MQEHVRVETIDWDAVYEAERFREPSRLLSPDVTRHFAWEGWDSRIKIPIKWLEHHTRAFHFSDNEILSGRTTRQMPNAGGVYFLFDGDECVYVGKAKCFSDRAQQHWDGGKRWTSHAYIEVPMMHAETVEAYYIRRIDPLLNNKYPPNRTYSDFVKKHRLDTDAPIKRKPSIIVVSAPRLPPTPER